MKPAGPDVFVQVQELLRQLRGIPQVREKQAGTFHLLGQAFVLFHEKDGTLHADLKKASGTGFDRFAVETAPEQRKLIDEAKRRATRITDE